jgi:hypothetical protein
MASFRCKKVLERLSVTYVSNGLALASVKSVNLGNNPSLGQEIDLTKVGAS